MDGLLDAGDLAVSLSRAGVLVDGLLGNEDTKVVSLHSQKTVDLFGAGDAVDGLLCNGVVVDDSLGAGVWADGSSLGTSFPHFGSLGAGVLEVVSSGSAGHGLLGNEFLSISNNKQKPFKPSGMVCLDFPGDGDTVDG